MIGTEEERIKELNELYPQWEDHTLWTGFERSVRNFAEKEFVVNESECYSYAQMHQKTVTAAKSLIALGVEPGDHVVCLLRNCTEYLMLMFAISAVGAVKVPVNPGLGRLEVTHIIQQSDAKWVIGEQIFDEAMFRACPRVQKLIVKGNNSLFQSDRILYWNDFLELSECVTMETFQNVSSSHQFPYRLSDILYTSGSTSMPKGVMITHDKIFRSAYASCLTRRMEIGRRMYVPLPFFHIFAYLEGIVPIMLCGGTLIISQMKFDAMQALVLMKTKKANDMICIMNMLEKMITVGKPKAEDFPNLHAAYFSPTHPEWVWDACSKGFGLKDITTGYGMTETVSAITYTSVLDYHDAVNGSNGRLKEGGCAVRKDVEPEWIEVKICDPNSGETLSDGNSGEICCRGPIITDGYYQNSEANERAFYPNGWFRTGDLGVMQSGRLSYISRLDEIYKVNGEKVSPQMVIHVTTQCPYVRMAEVVGVPHPHYKMVGAAFVDLREDTLEIRNAVKQYCKQNLAKFQIPKYFIFGSSQLWPKTGSQKINRKELKRQAEDLIGRNLDKEYLEYEKI